MIDDALDRLKVFAGITKQNKSEFEKTLEVYGQKIELLTSGLKFGHVQLMDIVTLVCMSRMKSLRRSNVIVDVNEHPNLNERVGKLFQQMNDDQLISLNRAIKKNLKFVNGAITTAEPFGKIFEDRYSRKTIEVRNCFPDKEYNCDYKIRSDFGLLPWHKVIVHNCTYATEYGSNVIPEILSLLPPEYHIVMVGGALNQASKERFEHLAHKFGVIDRLHYTAHIPNPDDYISFLRGADLGLIILDNKDANVNTCFPNRLSDLITAELPFISNEIPSVRDVVNTFNVGELVDASDPELVAKKIEETIGRNDVHQFYSEKIKRLKSTLSWENEIGKYEKLIETKKRNKNFLFVFPRGIVKNTRIFKLCKSQADKGYNVVIICGVKPPKKLLDAYQNVEVVRLPFTSEIDTDEISSLRSYLAAQLV